MKVRHLAKLVDVTPETVRYYTREGLLEATRDPNNGYKIYDKTALQNLQFIAQARTLGFSLKEIRGILNNANKGNSACPMVRGLLADKIKETEQKIQQLQDKLSLMKTTQADWQDKADALPSDNSVCPIIESVKHAK